MQLHNPNESHPHRFRIPLHVLTAGGSTILLLIVAAVLAWQAYRGTREVLSSTVDESIQHVSRVLQDKIRGILDPAVGQTELLGRYEIMHATTLQQRLAAVPVALSALESNQLLDAWYVGYPDGEFVLFRPLRDLNVRQVFKAPAEASLLVQTQTLEADGKRHGAYFFYDAAGRLLRREDHPTYVFDPRTRTWYNEAQGRSRLIMTSPYVFYTTRLVGATLARQVEPGGAVIGLDTTLRDLAHELEDLKITPGSLVAIVDRAGKVIASSDGLESAHFDKQGNAVLPLITELPQPQLIAAATLAQGDAHRAARTFDNGTWEIISIPVALRAEGQVLRVLMAVPHDELFRDARRLLREQLIITFLLILASVPAGYWLTQRLVQPLRALAEETRAVAAFDFSAAPPKRSRIVEVDLLSTATSQMKATIARFMDVSAALNSETRLERLLDVVLTDVAATTHARSAAIYLYDEGKRGLERSQLRREQGAHANYPERLDVEADIEHPAVRVMSLHQSAVGAAELGGPELVAVPLETLSQEFVGALVLELAHPLQATRDGGRDPILGFVEALSSTAAVAIETRHLVDSQKQLLEALIQLLAGAIDAKSPYTGGHCQRVPELTKMLAAAAQAADDGPFRDFRLSEEDWEAVHVGAWLHDCGKVTTPEYVVDKATKLETIYNRIHEVRMRFEVLKRDAEINYWKAREAGVPEAQARAAMEHLWHTLDDEFAFVATCNVGGEYLDPERVARLREIAQRSWMRTLDDRLGLSRDEERQLQDIPPASLPVVEPLLADKPQHLVPRPESELIPADNPWGFRLKVPQYKFDRGELHNLSVSRGTLTDEDRYIINEHIVQTIMMLERLPFPRHLKGVPEIAGGHHERMDGRGYPRGLTRKQMSVPARIMAIADVFEALTAADRPYKPPKTLSESLAIMARMTREQHLDGELFELFIRSDVYRRYAERYLQPAQMDAVDEAAILDAARPAELPVA